MVSFFFFFFFIKKFTGASMQTPMPLDDFQYMSLAEIILHQKKFDNIHQNGTDDEYSKNSKTGFIFVSKLEFTEETQKILLSYPLVPDHMVVEEDMLNQNQKELYVKLLGNNYSSTTVKKMVNSYATKEEYTSHYLLLSFLASLGIFKLILYMLQYIFLPLQV